MMSGHNMGNQEPRPGMSVAETEFLHRLRAGVLFDSDSDTDSEIKVDMDRETGDSLLLPFIGKEEEETICIKVEDNGSFPGVTSDGGRRPHIIEELVYACSLPEKIETMYKGPLEDTRVLGVGRCGGLGCQCGEDEDEDKELMYVGSSPEKIEKTYTGPLEDTGVLGVGRCGGLGCQCGDDESEVAKVTKVEKMILQKRWRVAPEVKEDRQGRLKMTRKTKARWTSSRETKS
jgi:hypothetical protein